MDSDTTQEGDDLRFEAHDELPDAEEGENFHLTNGLFNSCDDYLLDDEFTEKVPKSEFTPCGLSSLENSSSDGYLEHSGGFDNDSVGISKMSAVSLPVPTCKNDTLDEATICGIHGDFRNYCACQLKSKKKKQFKSSYSYDSDNQDENDVTFTRGLTFRRPALPSTNIQHNYSPQSQGVRRKEFCGRNAYAYVKNSADASNVSNIVTHKRSRMPTKRYIQESNSRSKTLKGKQKGSTPSKDSHPTIKFCNERHQMGFRSLKMDHEQISSNGASIQGPSKFEGRMKRALGHDPEEDSYTDESEYEYKTTVRSRKSDDRRKHQRMWTLSEVVKLVDGISQYGVGRWTEIKKLSFSTSAYRTPIDLRDKWRNLLRASHSWLQSEGEDEQKQKQASRPLPRAILHRVNELASIYPYPKQRKSKNIQDDELASIYRYPKQRKSKNTQYDSDTPSPTFNESRSKRKAVRR